MKVEYKKFVLGSLRWYCLISLFVIALFVGCSHEEDDEEHLLEHVIPAHKPDGYADAVSELSTRGLKVLSSGSTQGEYQELIDILDWMPEIAASSDLKHEQWNEVRDSTILLRQIADGSASDQKVQEWNSIISKLERLIPSADILLQQREAGQPGRANSSNILDDEVIVHD